MESIIDKFIGLVPKEDLEELKKIIEEKDREIERLKEEKEDLIKLADNKKWISPCYIKENYVSKEKIKEKIKELEENINYLKTFNDWFETDYTNEDIMNNVLEVLQELLEEE